jgi:hypothetical protein
MSQATATVRENPGARLPCLNDASYSQINCPLRLSPATAWYGRLWERCSPRQRFVGLALEPFAALVNSDREI